MTKTSHLGSFEGPGAYISYRWTCCGCPMTCCVVLVKTLRPKIPKVASDFGCLTWDILVSISEVLSTHNSCGNQRQLLVSKPLKIKARSLKRSTRTWGIQNQRPPLKIWVLIFLCFSLPNCKMEIIIPASLGCGENQLTLEKSHTHTESKHTSWKQLASEKPCKCFAKKFSLEWEISSSSITNDVQELCWESSAASAWLKMGLLGFRVVRRLCGNLHLKMTNTDSTN